jgi:hypothetical protein
MTTPDEAENRALTAANSIATQVSKLWMAAHADGMRNGIELAAGWCDGFATTAADDYEMDATARHITVIVARNMRDQLRLCALQVPDPETSSK